MTTPAGPISLANVQTEFGGTNPISLSEYYRGGANVPTDTVASAVDGSLISTSGAIRFGMFRSVTLALAAWANSVTMPGAVGFGDADGTFTATIQMGGSIGGSPLVGCRTFNGTSWTSNTSVSFPGRTNGGLAGTTTDAVFVAGMSGASTFSDVYKWNGTAFSTSGTWDYPTPISGHHLNGVSSSDCRQVGDAGGATAVFNGTTWTTSGSMVQNRRLNGGGGTSGSGMAVGGTISSVATATTEKNTGTTFTSAGNLPAAKGFHYSVGASATSAISFCGNASLGAGATSEVGNGTTWTSTANLNTARSSPCGSGTATDAFCLGGQNSGGTYLATTERYTP